MSAQTDKATVLVARFNEAGKLTATRFFREDERKQALALAATYAAHGIAHRLTETGASR